MKQLIYTSIASKGLDFADCASILKGAEINNSRCDITGVLLLKDQTFLQYLEGPDIEIERTLAIIRRDRRHTHLTVLADISRPVERRLFSDWCMGFHHLGAAEAALGPALISNSMSQRLDRVGLDASADLCARLLQAFWKANHRAIVRRGGALAAG